MFDVWDIETHKTHIVYAVAPVLSLSGEIVGTNFLFRKNNSWVWENANKYER